MKGLVRRTLPIGQCDITLEVYSEEGRMICSIFDVKGEIRLPPKLWLKAVRSELQILEQSAKASRCHEMRMAGRFTKKMFPDYEEYTTYRGDPGLKKVL